MVGCWPSRDATTRSSSRCIPARTPRLRGQLFIGLGTCGDCPGIQPPLAPELLPGAVLFREDSYRAPRADREGRRTASRRSGSRAATTNEYFDLAVAVDNSQRSAALIEKLPLNDAGRYRVELREANVGGGLGVKPTTTSGNFVGIWAQPGGDGACMGFENWSDGRLLDRFFIVPAERLRLRRTRRHGVCAVRLRRDRPADVRRSDMHDSDARYGREPDLLARRSRVRRAVRHEVRLSADGLLRARLVLRGRGEPRLRVTGGPINVNACLFMTPPSAKLKCTVPFDPQDNIHAHICKSDFTVDLLPQRAANSPLACVQAPDNRHMFERPRVGEASEFGEMIDLTTKDSAGMMYPFQFGIRYAFTTARTRCGSTARRRWARSCPARRCSSRSSGRCRAARGSTRCSCRSSSTYVNDCAREPICGASSPTRR